MFIYSLFKRPWYFSNALFCGKFFRLSNIHLLERWFHYLFFFFNYTFDRWQYRVEGNCTIVFRHTNELWNYSLNNTQQRKFLFAALRRFVLGAARLVVVRLVGCLRRNGLAGCWDGSVLLDVWGKYSRSPCSFVCLVIGESRRYLH